MGKLLKQYFLVGSYDVFKTFHLFFCKTYFNQTWQSGDLGSGFPLTKSYINYFENMAT